MSSKKKWKIREYRLQKDEDFYHQFFTKNQFPQLEFCVIPNKPHGTHRSGKTYHMCFYPKIGHGSCSIRLIPCSFIQCTSTLDKPLNPGVPPHQQPHYQPVKDCKYWHVLGSFKNWDNINFHISQYPVKILGKFIRSYYTESVITWMCWCKLAIMIPLTQQIQP